MDLLNTYKNILNPIKQGISNVVGGIGHAIQQVPQTISAVGHAATPSFTIPKMNLPQAPQVQNAIHSVQSIPQQAPQLLQKYTQMLQPTLKSMGNFNPGETLLQGIPGGNNDVQVLRQLHMSPPNLSQIGQNLQKQAKDYVGPHLTKEQAAKLTPEQFNQLDNQHLMQNFNMVTNIGGGEEDVAKATKYLRNKLDPSSARQIMDFINHVQTKGPQAAYEDSKIIDSIRNDLFGQKSVNWGNQKLANILDTVLGNVGKGTNKAGLGLAVNEIEHKVANPTDPFYNVQRVGVNPEQQQGLKQTVESLKPNIEQVVGKNLSHQEVLDYAQKTGKVLQDTIGFDQTKEMGAAAQNLRDQVANMAKQGKATPEFIDALIKDKSFGTHLSRLLGQRAITSSAADKPAMQAVLEAVLKKNQSADEILKAAQGVDFNDANQAASFYRQFVKPKVGDFIDLVRYNSMLSSPNTHINNAASNLLNTGVVAPVEKTLTGAVDYLSSKVTGKPQTQFASEGAAYAKGYYSHIGDAAHRFVDSMRGTLGSGNLDVNQIPVATSGKMGKLVSKLSLPTKLLEASDQFFTALTEGGESEALKLRQGKGVNVGDIQKTAQDNAAYRLYRGALQDPRQGHVLNAVDEVTQKIQQLRSSSNPVASTIAKFTLPFVRTPMNILKQMIEYSPAGAATLPGAANKTEQVSKAILGTAGMASAMMMVTSGRTTWAEPTDPAKRAAFRAAGLQPYSIKIGDNWYAYSKLPPAMSIPLAIASALHNADENKTLNQSQIDAVLTGVASVGGFFSDQSYLKNIGDAIASIKGSPENKSSIVGNYVQQLVPYRALLGWMAHITDPYQRKVDTNASILQQQVQQLLTQIPGASNTVPARTDQFGEPIKNQHPVLNAVSPLKVTTENPDSKQMFDLMQQKTQNTRNQGAIKKMILQGKDVTGLEQAGAAEKTPLNPQQQLKNQLQEQVARQKAKLKGTTEQANGKVIFNVDGKVRSINTDTTVTPPDKTGNTELDTVRTAQYKNSVSAKIKDITSLYNIGQISANEAEQKIQDLKAQEAKVTNQTLTPPTMTGNPNLDKALVTKYQGELTTQIHTVAAQYSAGKITADQAEQQISQLKSQSGARGRKGKQVRVKLHALSFKLPKASPIKVSPVKSVKQYKPLKIKPLKPVKSLTRH